MSDKKSRVRIPPESSTRETLPPISPEAQAILDQVKADAKKWEESPEGKATRARAEKALETGGVADFIGIMLGARGYE